ncbi:MAG TPA: hypothetical protein VGB42_09415 [Candidatus Thermoplasmatota archaeon]
MRRALLLAALALATGGCATPGTGGLPEAHPDALTDTVAPPRGQRFYGARSWGSEAQFNPVSLVLNGGFDQLRTEGGYRHVLEFPYGKMATNVLHSIGNAERALRGYGWSDWLRDEVLPLSTKGEGGGQWVPNYLLHLFAGGMTGVRITEWYARHGTPHPEVAAFGTVYAWHFLTEMVEHGAGDGRSVDAITDLLIFDLAAFFLWRGERVQRLFSTNVEMTNWPGQPSLTFPGPTLQNMQMTAMVRVRVPGLEPWRPMSTLGASFLLGLSRRVQGEDWLSLGAGWDPSENPVIDPATGKKTVVLNPNAGLFWDREGSLLASLIVRANRTERVLLNVYPGVVRVAGYSPGLSAQWLARDGWRFGVSTTWGIGVGTER